MPQRPVEQAEGRQVDDSLSSPHYDCRCSTCRAFRWPLLSRLWVCGEATSDCACQSFVSGVVASRATLITGCPLRVTSIPSQPPSRIQNSSAVFTYAVLSCPIRAIRRLQCFTELSGCRYPPFLRFEQDEAICILRSPAPSAGIPFPRYPLIHRHRGPGGS
jgi:hypothetical protein